MTNSTHIPTGNTSSLAADDPRSVIAQAVALAGDTIAAVRPDQLDLPTPCDEFTARQLIGHLLTVLQRVAVLGEGGDPMAMPSVTVVPDDEITAAWHAAAHRVQAAWTDDALLDQMMVLPWATAPGSGMLATYTNELSVHTWDLAAAIGPHGTTGCSPSRSRRSSARCPAPAGLRASPPRSRRCRPAR